MKAQTVTRRYKSALRDEQVAQTRERLLEAVQRVIVEDGPTELSVAQVAEKANVAVRTAYRYFTTKEQLIDEYNAWSRRKIGHGDIALRTVDDVVASAAQLFRGYEENAGAIRAMRATPANVEVRKRRKQEQMRTMQKALTPLIGKIGIEEGRALAAVMHTLLGSDAFLNMHDYWGLNSEQSARAVQKALQVLIDHANEQGGSDVHG